MTIRVNVNVKRKFIVGGKEYRSIEEMPANIRQAYEKAMGSSSPTDHPPNLVTSKTSIIFGGQEYESIEAMPGDVRQVYEKVMKALETGEVPPEIISGAEVGGASMTSRGEEGRPTLGDFPKPIEPEPSFSFSPRWMIVGLILIVLLWGLYYLLHYGGAR